MADWDQDQHCHIDGHEARRDAKLANKHHDLNKVGLKLKLSSQDQQ